MLVLDSDDVRSLLDAPSLRAALAKGYSALTEGRADAPVRSIARTPTGLLAAMPGYVEGIGLAAKLVTVVPSNADRGIPSHMGIVVLFDTETGVPLALLDGEVITEMRTSASAALACDLLAPADVSVLTVIGAGVQAAGHLTAFRDIRGWSEIRLANRTSAHARELAGRYDGVSVFSDIDEAVEGADVVACTTDSPDPVFDPDRFQGRHLSSVGLHHELPPSLVRSGRVVVQTHAAATTPPPNGPPAVQGLTDVTELGEIVLGRRTARPDDRHTVWVSVGHAIEDVVAARLTYDRAVEAGVGRDLDL